MKQESIIVIEIMPTVTIPKDPLLVFASKVILETVLIAQVTISKRLDILRIKRIAVDVKWNSVRSEKRGTTPVIEGNQSDSWSISTINLDCLKKCLSSKEPPLILIRRLYYILFFSQ